MLTAVDVPLTIKSKDKEKGKEKILKALGGDDAVSRALEREDGKITTESESRTPERARTQIRRFSKQKAESSHTNERSSDCSWCCEEYTCI